MISVSVIICTWNRVAQLTAMLSSLSMQTGVAGLPIEVLVVDNNSTDGTRELVNSLETDWPLGNLRYVFEPCQGKQFALNAGIRSARYRLLAFSDDDVFFEDNWIAAIVELFSLGHAELAGGKSMILWPDSGPPDWYSDSLQAVLGGVDLGAHRILPAPPDFAPAGANLVVTRQLLEKVGMFSEAHFRHMDHEFGVRCQRAGACVAYEPSMVVHVPVDINCLEKDYFLRWAFKAGLALDAVDSSAKPWKIPLWVYRQWAEDYLGFSSTDGTSSGPAVNFRRQMRAQRMWGHIAGAWHAWLRPNHHHDWVVRHSQKKGNKVF